MDPGKVIAAATVAVVVLAVAVVAVLTGGVGLLEDDRPTSPADLDESDTPPGVSPGGGVTDAGDLARAHRGSLDGRSFEAVLRVERTEREEGLERTVTQNQTARVGADGTVLVEFVERTDRGEVVREVWSNGTVAVSRATRDGETRYQRVAPGSSPGGLATRAVEQLLDAGDYRIDDVEQRRGRTVLVLTAGEPNEGAEVGEVVGDVRSVESYSGRAVVDRDGRIYRLDGIVEFVDQRGATVTAEFDYWLRHVGGVTVDRPDWVPTALERTRNGALERTGGEARARR